jgi:hypothetical protein
MAVGDHEPGCLKCPVVACDLFGDGLVESFGRGFAFNDDLWLHGVIVEYKICAYGCSSVSSLEWNFEGEAVSAPSLGVEQRSRSVCVSALLDAACTGVSDGVDDMRTPSQLEHAKVVHGLGFI